MIRSLFAVIIAVLAGFSLGKIVEGGGAAVSGAAPGSALYDAIMLFGWLLGAFAAALLALLIGRRWAPLGGLAAASILLGAVITLFSYPLSWIMWPSAILVTALGGYAAIKLTNATSEHPALKRKSGLFDE